MSSGPQLASRDFLKVGGNGLRRPFRATLPKNSTGRSKYNLMSPRIPWIFKLNFKILPINDEVMLAEKRTDKHKWMLFMAIYPNFERAEATSEWSVLDMKRTHIVDSSILMQPSYLEKKWASRNGCPWHLNCSGWWEFGVQCFWRHQKVDIVMYLC